MSITLGGARMGDGSTSHQTARNGDESKERARSPTGWEKRKEVVGRRSGTDSNSNTGVRHPQAAKQGTMPASCTPSPKPAPQPTPTCPHPQGRNTRNLPLPAALPCTWPRRRGGPPAALQPWQAMPPPSPALWSANSLFGSHRHPRQLPQYSPPICAANRAEPGGYARRQSSAGQRARL